MHNSYYFLRIVARDLDSRLRGYRLVSCFSQSKDELIIEYHKDPHHFFIRASLVPDLPSVSYPSSIKRAGRNSVDLFSDLIMKKVEGAESYENDRSFRINLEGGYGLLYKMHGNRSNVLLLQGEHVLDAFRKSIVADLTLAPSSLNTKIDWSKPMADPEKDLFTFSKVVWNYLEEQGIKEKTVEEQWKMITDTRDKLEMAHEFFHIKSHNGLVAFSLLPYNTIAARFTDPLEAVTAFVAAYSSQLAFNREKGSLIRQLENDILKVKAYLRKTQDQLGKLTTDQHFQVWADLLMANLDNVKPRDESVTLANFYDGDRPVAIRINPQLSPQRNAEVYYRKSKNRSIELTRTREMLIAKEMELLKLTQLLSRAKGVTSLADVRAIVAKETVPVQTPETRLPYREVVYSGFKIWIGRDARDNDELTLHYAFKEDLWLHAKDAAGSHVLVKHQAGKVFPKAVVERAAQLAAYYSKRKTESLCPVAYTAKKYVRKRKGDPAGAVVVERETVILVEPRGMD